jgi:hypothetical protein
MHKHCPKMGLFWSIILSQIRLTVGPISMVLPITSLFLIRFLSVKYRIEGLNVIFPMARKWSIKSWFCSGHFLVKLQSNMVNSGQTFPNLTKCALDHVLRAFWCIWATLGLNSAQSSYLVLHANTRENPKGKNRVMTMPTTPPSKLLLNLTKKFNHV